MCMQLDIQPKNPVVPKHVHVLVHAVAFVGLVYLSELLCIHFLLTINFGLYKLCTYR